MSRPKLVCDGLWRCLCPAFDNDALRRALQAPILNRASARPTRTVSRPRWRQERFFGGLAPAAMENNPHELEKPTITSTPQLIDGKPLLAVLFAPTPPTPDQLETIATDDLMDALRRIREPEGYKMQPGKVDRHQRIIQLVTHLIRVRGEASSPFLYECLMDAMIDPQGSATGVRNLLLDMEKNEVTITATICQSALAALAVHPDYALRHQVIMTMQEHWFPMDQYATQHIALGLLRDGQHELAYGKIMELVEEKGPIDLWVYDIFIFAFGRLGHLDEMVQLLIHRKMVRGSDAAFLGIMNYVLDTCSSAFHYQGTVFAWNAAFRARSSTTADGVLENVLATAAKQGDVELATEVLDITSGRGKVQIHHYEALAEAFVNNENISGALRVFGIMDRNGIPLSKGHTRFLFQALRDKEHLFEQAEPALRNMAKDNTVPIALISVLIESTSRLRGSESAMTLYKDVKMLTGEEPDAVIMQDLILHSRDKATIRMLLDDYKDKIPSDASPPGRLKWAYDKLITICLDMNELDLALRFAQKVLHPNMRGTKDLPWLKELVEQTVVAEDNRVWEMLDQLSAAGNKTAVTIAQKAMRMKRMARKADEMQKAAASTT